MTLSIHPIEIAFDKKMSIGECPLWHYQENKLYWIDIAACSVHQLCPIQHTHQSWQLLSEPGCIAINQQGGLIVALRTGLIHLDTNAGIQTSIAQAPYDIRSTRFNDGRCDAKGRLWVGTLYEPRDLKNAAIYCVEKNTITKQWGNLTNANGLLFDDKRKRLLHADTTEHAIYAYDFDSNTGTANNPHIFHQFNTDKTKNYLGRPDGAAIDSQGCYWYAMYEGACLIRFNAAGEILQQIDLPLRCPTMLAFGDEDLRSLYITSASLNRPTQELIDYPLSGLVLKMRVDIAGIKEHTYRK